MARRISTGVLGKNVLGSLSTSFNTISSVVLDQDIGLSPSGTGEINVSSHVLVGNEKLLKLGDSGSTNWIGFRAPTAVDSNVTLTFPATAGTSGYTLTTDGSGTLSWENVAVQVDDTISASATEHNVLMTTATSGGITTVNAVSSKITFKPSTGTLFLKNNTGSTSTITGTMVVTGGVGISQNCYVGGTMNAVAITESSSITLKENITPIENALDTITQLAGVIYDRKNGSSINEAGLIAEDVNIVLPNIVGKDANGNPESIMYTKLSAYLIEAVKQLKSEINDLRNDK